MAANILPGHFAHNTLSMVDLGSSYWEFIRLINVGVLDFASEESGKLMVMDRFNSLVKLALFPEYFELLFSF